ncbi:MAG: pantoate--beta-alanine ligase [Planctomycetota bacterium]|jgi:pantoate--beta-alanine ligase
MSAASPKPTLVTTVREVREILDAVRLQGRKIGFVPTMGALHEGHLSLVRASNEECDYTVVSIYVNPSQFGAGEGFGRYPRTLEADLGALAPHGVPLVFTPSSDEVYPQGYATWIEVGSVAEGLEGASRPGHFRGVATVVLKLLNMVGPQVAYLGQKDYQQALVIRRMVEDLNLPVTIRICPIVREPDGLAMSSRNAYLSLNARQQACVLWKSLCLAAELVEEGERSAAAVADRMRRVIGSVEGATVDYVALVDPETLRPVSEIAGSALAAVAVRIEDTRLIDNRLLKSPTESEPT